MKAKPHNDVPSRMTRMSVGHGRTVPMAQSRRSVVPISHDLKPIALETAFLEPPIHHRWLLTTCIAGIAATLIVGGVTLGLFGHNAAPPVAQAAISQDDAVVTLSKPRQSETSTDSLATAAPGKQAEATEVLPERDMQDGWAYPEITENELPYGDATSVLDSEIAAVESENQNFTEISKTAPPEPVDETFRLAKGSSLIRELTNRGVSTAAAEQLVAALNPVMPVKLIKPGTEFEVTFDRQIDFYGREAIFPVELSFKPGPKETVLVSADEDGNFDARISGKLEGTKSQYAEKPKVLHFRATDKVGSSLYATAKDNKIPEYIVAEYTRVLSYDVDFQNQIDSSDSFKMFFGQPLSGTSSKRSVLHYAELNYGGKVKRYYRFTDADGRTDYFDEFGRSAARALLKTPVSGVKITSGFGMRRHPLLRYSKMHTGVDFGAPTGTPIRAAGAGVVDLAGRHGAYGNTIVLKHGVKYKTLYAHMSRLAAGIRSGVSVNQGQIIGYVGTSGRSTGPHLHFEVRVKDRPVNPTGINAKGGKQLAGKDLTNFRLQKAKVMALMEKAPSAVQVAQAGQ